MLFVIKYTRNLFGQLVLVFSRINNIESESVQFSSVRQMLFSKKWSHKINWPSETLKSYLAWVENNQLRQVH